MAIRRRGRSRPSSWWVSLRQLSIANQVSVVGGGAAVPGATLEYVVRVDKYLGSARHECRHYRQSRLIATRPACLCERIGDDKWFDVGLQFRRIDHHRQLRRRQRNVGAGRRCGAPVPRHSQPVACDGHACVTNTGVVTWNTPTQTASASVSLFVGGIPGVSDTERHCVA